MPGKPCSGNKREDRLTDMISQNVTVGPLDSHIFILSSAGELSSPALRDDRSVADLCIRKGPAIVVVSAPEGITADQKLAGILRYFEEVEKRPLMIFPQTGPEDDEKFRAICSGLKAGHWVFVTLSGPVAGHPDTVIHRLRSCLRDARP
ncbi:hypothetical protein BSU01_23220 [Erwinia billingiae]|nr:hypothetical protein [Erwinia billingiae]